jgi:hypothetical protein
MFASESTGILVVYSRLRYYFEPMIIANTTRLFRSPISITRVQQSDLSSLVCALCDSGLYGQLCFFYSGGPRWSSKTFP